MCKSHHFALILLSFGIGHAAYATPLTGVLDLSGTSFRYDSKGPSAGDLRFNGTTDSSGGTGDLTVADGQKAIYGYNGSNDLFVTSPGAGLAVTSFPELLFTISNGKAGIERDTFTFDATSFLGSPGTGDIEIFGILTEAFADGDPSESHPYEFLLIPDGSDTNNAVGYTAVLSPTPEPSSLILLGTGALGFASLIRRRSGTTGRLAA